MEAVEFIEEQTKSGKKVYVHCKAGRGRSVSVAMAHLLKSKAYANFLDAYKFFKGVRPQISLNSRQQATIQQYQNANELMQHQTEVRDLFQKFEDMKQLVEKRSRDSLYQHCYTKITSLLNENKLVCVHNKQLHPEEEGQEFIVLENTEYVDLYARVCTVKRDPQGMLYFSPNVNEEILLVSRQPQLPFSTSEINDRTLYFEKLKSFQGQRHFLPPDWVQSLLRGVKLNIPDETVWIDVENERACVYKDIVTDITRTSKIMINGEMIYDNRNPQHVHTIVQAFHQKLGLSIKHTLETLKLCTQASSVYGTKVNHWLLESKWASPLVVKRSITIHTLEQGQTEICVDSIIAMQDKGDKKLLRFFFKDTLHMVLNNQDLENKSMNPRTTPLMTETLSPCFSSQELAEKYGKPLSVGQLIVQKLLTVKGAVVSGLFASCILIPLSIAHLAWQGKLTEWNTMKTVRLATTPLAIFWGGSWAIRKIQQAVES